LEIDGEKRVLPKNLAAIYQKIDRVEQGKERELLKTLSTDAGKILSKFNFVRSDETKTFYRMLQNKVDFAEVNSSLSSQMKL